MTDDALSEFFSRLDSLFPGKVSDAAVAEWSKWVRRLEASEAMAALSEYYATGKNPSDGPTPSLAGFRRCVRVQRADEQATQTDPALAKMQQWTADAREAMASALPDRREEIYSWGTEEFWERLSAWVFAKACRKYADRPIPDPTARGVFIPFDARVYAYGQWRCWAKRIGKVIPPFQMAMETVLGKAVAA